MHIIGLDLSLTSTGLVAVRDGQVHRVERITRDSLSENASLEERILRLHNLRLDVGLSSCPPHDTPDLVLIEGPAHGVGRQRGTWDRSGFWWYMVDWFACHTQAGIPVVEVPPATLKKYATGNGAAGKEAVLVAAVRRFPTVDVNTNDEADALWLAAIGSQYVGQPIVELPKTHLAFLNKIRWPQDARDLAPAEALV
jgi:crossover junction endodeoxyribonuclease RuvC